MPKGDWVDLIVDSKSSSKTRRTSASKKRKAEPETPPVSGKVPALWMTVSVIALILGAALTYFVYDLNRQQTLHRQAVQAFIQEMGQTLQIIERRLDEDESRIADLGSQIEVTMERVGVTQRELSRARALAQQLKEEQERNVATFTREIQQKANLEEVSQLESQANQKFDGVNREISDVRSDVESTRQDLMNTITELSDLGVKVNEQGQMIATNLQGVEELRRRGERDYITFELSKRVKTRVAGITLELRDTDGSPRDADIRIYVNDSEIERENVSENAPVNFYVRGSDKRVPYELVLNEIFHKPDRVKGYISVPKGVLPEGPPRLG